MKLYLYSSLLIATADLAAARPKDGTCSPAKCNISALSESVPGGEVVSVDFHANGEGITLDLVPSCGGPGFVTNATADVCRVVVNVPTSDTSTVRVEAWLPAGKDKWNGRLLATGNGGIGGCIDYRTMQIGARLGFATFGTNAGHDGEIGHDFFLNKPESIADFGHRAIHVEAETGKRVIKGYYGRAQDHSYYQACSTGGRQGFQTAYLYPEDFDGMLLGAPGMDWLHIVASKGILARRVGWPKFDSEQYVRPEQWSNIVAKQVEMYDGLDGIKDGIIDDPTAIRFHPETMACGTGVLNETLCLNPKQVLSVKAAYEPLTDLNGNIVYPPFPVGVTTGVFSENQVNGTELAYRVLDDFWRGAVYNDSTWNSHNFTVEDMDFAVKVNPGGVGFRNPDLSAYHSRGGKIMAYHGHSDQTITPHLAHKYFSEIQAALDLDVEDMLSFYRLFMIPGHFHCAGGPGAWNMGQVYPLDETKLDERHNALLALVKWVEDGKAPVTMVGTKYPGDDVRKPAEAERTHCPYPYKSVWDGKGNSRDAQSYTCKI